jgi:hypothetical protein
MAAHLQILDHGHVGEDAPTLGTMGDAKLQNATGRGGRDVLPLEDELAAGRRYKPDIAFGVVSCPPVGADQRAIRLSELSEVAGAFASVAAVRPSAVNTSAPFA